MRIGIVAPMASELRPVVRAGQLHQTMMLGSCRARRAEIGLLDVVAVRGGIGTRRAARVAEQLIVEANAQHVLVSGIAGGLSGDAHIGSLVVPATVLDLGTGRTYEATPFGPVEPTGSVVTSDSLIIDPSGLAMLGARGHAAIDMETAAVARVCHDHGIPWTAFRAVSDRVGDGVDEAIAALARPDGSADLGGALRYVARRPWAIPRLVRLGRGATLAAKVAASAAIEACQAWPGDDGQPATTDSVQPGKR